jgi:enoyl-CoA hydratase
MAETNIRYTEESGIGIMTISRPEVRNALNDLIIRDINLLLNSIQYSKSIRVLVITGEGKAFVAGADILKMQDLESEEAYIWSKTGQETFKRIINLDIPVIAAINGYALGGGLELALSCDIRIASSEAKFGSPEVGLGLIPGYGGTKLLVELIGPGDAMNIILSGQMIDAQEALRLKLIQKVVEPEKLMETARQLGLMIAEKSYFAVSSARKAIREGMKMGIDEAMDAEAKRFSETFSHDAHEGMSAFLEKRKPVWKTGDRSPGTEA